MKLSVWSSYYYELSPEDAVLEFEKHGYRYCELSDEHALVLMERGDPIVVGEQFAAFAAQHGVSFLQGHLLLSAMICEEESLAILEKQLDLFRAIGIQAAVLHCDSMNCNPELSLSEKQARNLAALHRLITHIDDTDMVICLENLGPSSIVPCVDDLLYYVNALNSHHVGICLDTGHLNLTENRNQRDFILAAGRHIKALHIADNEGERDQHLIPFGCGTVDMCEVISTLKEIGYDGLYNLEIPGEKSSLMPIRGLKLDYIKKMFDYLEDYQ